jgi:uncharacterized repeat protein (TIGR01451 family)
MNATGIPPNGDSVFAETYANATLYYANASAVKANLTAQIASQGGIIQYQINITNTGNVTMTILVNDTIDSALTYNASSPTGTNISQNVNWTLSDVLAGETRTLYLNTTVNNYPSECQNTLNSLSVLGIPPNGNNVTASANLTVPICLANLSVIKLNQTALQPSPGGTVQFNITLNNTGNTSLTYYLLDTLPSGLTYLASHPTGTNSSQNVNWSGSLASGASTVFYLNATVNAGVVNSTNPSRTLTNNVTVTASPPNGNNISAASSANITIYYANVSVLKVDITPTPVSSGGLVQWKINISNPGEVALAPVVVMDTLPENFTYNSSSVSYDSISSDNRSINWSIASIAAGANSVIYLNSSVGSVANGTYYNNVTVIGVPPNGANVTASDSAAVGILAPGINVVKTASASSFTAGGQLTFTLTITNTGSSNLTVSVVDSLPSGITFVSANVTPTNSSGQNITWNAFTNLSSGDSVSISYLVASSTAGSYSNNVSVTGTPASGYNVTDNTSLQFTVSAPATFIDSASAPSRPRLSISVSKSCELNLISVMSNENQVDDVNMVVFDSNTLFDIPIVLDRGRLGFKGCGRTVRLHASKSGYLPADLNTELLSCDACLPLQQNNETANQSENQVQPPSESEAPVAEPATQNPQPEERSLPENPENRTGETPAVLVSGTSASAQAVASSNLSGPTDSDLLTIGPIIGISILILLLGAATYYFLMRHSS